MNANQAIGYGDVAPLALLGIPEERIRHPDAVDQ